MSKAAVNESKILVVGLTIVKHIIQRLVRLISAAFDCQSFVIVK